MTGPAAGAGVLLAIETSCDETAAAVVGEDGSIRSSVVSSQIDLHARFGGVVPEVAGRAHLDLMGPVVAEALGAAGVEGRDLAAVAATAGPGLIGSLLVGVSAAKGYALAWDRPYLGVNHLEAHLHAAFIEAPRLELPVVVLLVSGGHTLLISMEAPDGPGAGGAGGPGGAAGGPAGAAGSDPAGGPGLAGQIGLPLRYRLLGQTIDDAAGEAFDKVARYMGLGYPGGPAIDRAARDGDPGAIRFPRAMLDDGYDFSFSGLKTSVITWLRKHPDAPVVDVAASFQEAVVDVLARKARRAAAATQARGICLGGGVAANSSLRRRIAEVCAEDGIAAFVPGMALCTDNAAMVGVTAWYRLRTAGPTPLSAGADPNLKLPLV